ncbi:ABC transporter substrate-binding protein [Calothrix sp. NIES-3974]|uniref:ABC transporter substrate-binding protein n=1 Tax=Calothrix sp. NIES-3974 TaxID=2005462 RepID=UPI000BBC65CD|nr:ABC transporter substrate-binding protein [Calothrix sp. NIES-3974]
MPYHRFFKIILCIGLSLIFTACSSVNPTISDNTTTTTPTIIATPPSQSVANRVVSLTSLAADIIYQLDQNKLVGIAGSSLLNQDERFANIPRVGEGRTPPNLEKIVALKPDLVIGAEGFSNQIINRLTELNIPTILTKVDSWQGLTELTKNLASKINADPQPLLQRYQGFLSSNQNSNFSALVLVSNQPILSPNKSSWAGDLLAQFQIRNIAAELQGKSPIQGYVTLSAEKVLEANPETLLVVNSPFGERLLDNFQKEPFWSKIKATQNQRIFEFDYYGLVNPGSINSIEKACQQLREITQKSA